MKTMLIWLLAAGICLTGGTHDYSDRSEVELPPVDAKPEPDSRGMMEWPRSQPVWTNARLGAVMEKINGEAADELTETYGIILLSAGAGQGRIEATVRRFGDFERPLAEEELQAVRSFLYKAAGEIFPLVIENYVCCGEPLIVGKITKVDEKTGVVLVVDEEQMIKPDMPEALWFRLEQDGRVEGGESGSRLTWADLRIGQQVSVWQQGMILTSYPGRAAALKIKVAGL
ncbi:hypothetical protein SAMN02799630_02220 [Paenibacillus sp. UNCCL117]|uniref:DUF3221 domain-containing protein n=1 Tax=unclassified Paenibacillus TaxID=185978 RepID=UPI00088D949E|nr:MULTISPECIES: DUF3221 domain-containing protein [unclassified Paenibacillus]SDD14168.1 hypothetical protein SAMN04488602_10696 [Paenibacillus sp. cl123]SFW34158.1 hypothetical protein SAMN02799630_02220 [Paenibacillus sp. UNCCL117]